MVMVIACLLACLPACLLACLPACLPAMASMIEIGGGSMEFEQGDTHADTRNATSKRTRNRAHRAHTHTHQHKRTQSQHTHTKPDIHTQTRTHTYTKGTRNDIIQEKHDARHTAQHTTYTWYMRAPQSTRRKAEDIFVAFFLLHDNRSSLVPLQSTFACRHDAAIVAAA